MVVRLVLIMFVAAMTAVSQQIPPIEPGVSLEQAKWRSARYSDVRYKLNLTLEKMSPVLKGTMEIRVKVGGRTLLSASQSGDEVPPIILDWRKIIGSESLSTISNVSLNGVNSAPFVQPYVGAEAEPLPVDPKASVPEMSRADRSVRAPIESNEHLIFRDGVVAGENVIKLDFTSPILTSGSAITRYVDKEDGAEYIYSLFVPSDASTAFPVFDQPDLKARFTLSIKSEFVEGRWQSLISNAPYVKGGIYADSLHQIEERKTWQVAEFEETKPISTYVFAFAAGPFERVSEPGTIVTGDFEVAKGASGGNVKAPVTTVPGSDSHFYVRKSQAAKFKPHSAEVFRLNREGIKFLESYFDYKFPFPKYDIVLIPEFPFGGMEHAGATFLRESSIIFPQEPTKNDYISRANVIFHEAAHQWFGDTVTMKWFDDLWLKEGFAEFMAYKTLEKVMPEYNAWKVFYERNKQAAYLTDSTKGTTPIYQEIANLSAAKSAYGNIVYRKAPSFLRQAEFYLGPDKFQTAVRAFLKKHEYTNAGFEDLVNEFEIAGGEGERLFQASAKESLAEWATSWIRGRGVSRTKVVQTGQGPPFGLRTETQNALETESLMPRQLSRFLIRYQNGQELRDLLIGGPTDSPTSRTESLTRILYGSTGKPESSPGTEEPKFIIPNYQDYGYGIFLLDDKSRDYVLKNIGSEKDDFLRTMMWGSLWDSVREGELDPKEYVELVVKNLSAQSARFSSSSKSGKGQAKACTLNCGETDESTIQTLLSRVSTAMRYYIDAGISGSEPGTIVTGALAPGKKSAAQRTKTPVTIVPGSDSRPNPTILSERLEALLVDRMQNASTPGQRITYYRSFLNIASSENARRIMKEILKKSVSNVSVPPAVAGGALAPVKQSPDQLQKTPPDTAGGTDAKSDAAAMRITTKDKFDIVSRLIILGDPEAPKLLAELEKTETSDEAKRYAYAAKAGFATAENKAKFWNDFINNKEISESWIEAAFGPFNNVRHSELTLPYLEKALAELPNLKRSRKIFFVNGWLGAFVGGQKSEAALKIVNDFLAKNPGLDKDLRLKILENVDVIERAVKIRSQNRER